MIEKPTTSEELVVRSPWWRRTASFLLRWVYRLTGITIIASAFIVLLAQTDMARSFMKTQVLSLLNEQLLGKVACDDVRLDIFRGIVLEHPQLYANGTTFLEADQLSVSYDLAAVLGRTLAINNVDIVRPRIKVIRSNDGLWNIERIVKPSTDTVSSPPPNLVIRVRGISINEGECTVNDRTTSRGNGSQFDPTHLTLKALELRAALRIALVEKDYSFAINHLSFYDQYTPTIDLRELTLAGRIQPEGLDLQTLAIKLAHTELALSARIDGVDVLRDGINDSLLALHPIIGDIDVDSVWGPDIAFVVPDVKFADSYSLKAHTSFYGAKMNIDDIDLHAGIDHVKGSVKLTGIDGPNIGVDILINDSHAQYVNIRRRLLLVELPELPFLETTTIENAHIRGHPADSLWIEAHGSDRPGRIDGSLTLYLAEKRLGYKVDMRVEKGDLAVFADSSMATMINGRVNIHGKGVTLQDMEGTYQCDLDRSTVLGRPVRRAQFVLRANGAGGLSIDTLFADVTPFRRDTVDEYALTPDDRIVGVSGTMNAADVNHLRYAGHVNFSALNLADLLEVQSLPSRFTGSLDIDAEGTTVDSLLGSVRARIDEFALEDRALLPFDLNCKIVKDGSVRSIAVDAPFLTARISGAYAPSALIDAITASVNLTADAVKQRIRHLYSTSGYVEHMGSTLVPAEASFMVDLRDASPVNIFFSGLSISANAMIRGAIRSGSDSLVVRIDTLDVADLSVKTDSLKIQCDPLHLSSTIRLYDISTSPRVAELTVVGRCDTMLVVNGIRVKRPSINLTTERDLIRLRARADVNSITAGVRMTGRFHEDSTDLTFDSIYVAVDTARKLEWRSLRPAGISLRDASFNIRDLAVQRSYAENVIVNGRFSLDEFDDLNLDVENFDLSNIPRFVNLEKGHPVRFVDGFVKNISARVNGTWEQPVIDLAINASGVQYNGELIGTLATKLHHENKDITGCLSIANPALATQSKTLDLQVTHLPVDLGLRGVKQRFVDNRPMDVELKASKLALAAIEPFLPAIERLQGVADGVITVKGTTPDNIDLGGNARFANASFLSSATNVVYNADGVLHLEGSNLFLDTVVVRNVERDRKNGVAYANGLVVFDGLAVESIDFKLRSKGILVLNKSSQARSPKVFGDMIIATGNAPIHFFGKLDQPVLEGDIHVLYADILFPQERSTTKSRYTAFEYNRTSDTSKRYNSVVDATRRTRLTSDTVTNRRDQSPVVDAIESIVKSTTASFVDILRYDLNIYLKGRTLMTMVFGKLELLIADLEQVDQKIPLNFTGRFVDNSTNLRGKVRVKDGTSTYKFYKPFVASGTLDFTNGGMTDPSLDLKAVYKDRRTLSNGKQEDFRVEVVIKGTKLKPTAVWSVYRQDRKQEGDSAKITGDALMLILVGKTQDELVSSGQGNLVGEVNGAMSAVATSALGDLLSGIGGLVQSAQVDLGSDLSQSRLTVSGQLFSDVSYRLSGQISDFAGNSTITVTVPFTVLSDAEAMRYFMLDVSRSVNNSGNITRYQRLWEVKLGARLP
ncbi:MAG: translocation/assembly module TamB domain-containing protein [Candidatus Kapabacteria bacterium]|nr:translocation/assembly module TamB domain-containing protein [Candidatus Kapabacteria bacterium]